MDYTTLKIIHLTGLALTFMGLAGILAFKASGAEVPLRKRLIFHVSFGVGWLMLGGAGFSMAPAWQQPHMASGWIQAKMGIWLLTGASMALATRLSRFTVPVLLVFTALVLTAAWLAVEKPF